MDVVLGSARVTLYLPCDLQWEIGLVFGSITITLTTRRRDYIRGWRRRSGRWLRNFDVRVVGEEIW